MNNHAMSYKRFWQPSYLQAISLSVFSGAIASAITYPFQFCKTVIQFQSTAIGYRDRRVWYQGYNPFKVIRSVHASGAGLSGIFVGFDAHLYGRLSYLVIRNTLYKIIYDQSKPVKKVNDLSYREKAIIGGVAGSIAAAVTTPFTLISIRQILDGQIRPEWRRNYSSSILEALKQVRGKGELGTGVTINVIRHFLLNISLTGPYDYFKEGFYTRFGDYGFVNPLALAIATFVGAAVTLPFDNIRTKIMQLHAHPERNRMNFDSIAKAFLLSLTHETHPFALWAGFYTYYPATFLYAYLTVGITNQFTESWKRKEGLLEWQI